MVEFTNEENSIIVRTIKEKYPDFKQIKPEFTDQFVFEKSALLSALKQLKPYIDTRWGGKSIGLFLKDGKLTLKAENKEIGKKEVVVNLVSQKKVSSPEGFPEGTIIMPMKGGEYK